MDDMDRPDLRTYLAQRGGRLPAAEAAGVGAQVAAALFVAYARGIVHRDLRMESLRVVPEGAPTTVQVTGFENAPAGADAAATAAADVYALGGILVELVTGSPDGDVDDLPPALAQVVRRCLAGSPAERPDARDLGPLLRAAEIDLRGPAAGSGPEWTGGSAPLIAPTPRPQRRPGRGRVILAGVLGLLVVLGLGFGGYRLAAAASDDDNDAVVAVPAVTVSASPSPAEVTAAPRPSLSTQPLGDPDAPQRATFAAHLPKGAGTLYLAVRDGVGIAYLCDGDRVEAWFKGTAANGRLDMPGRKAGNALRGTYDARGAAGEVTLKGKATAFDIPRVQKPSSLYRAAARVRNAEVDGAWIVLPDGSQVGVLTNAGVAGPAPKLDTTTRTAPVTGGTVTATEIDTESGTGF